MMREAERRELRRVKVLLRAGNRTEALAALDAIVSPPKRKAPPLEQLVLACVEFTCERLRSPMQVGECLRRRGDVWPSGGRKGKQKNLECRGCQQGDFNAWACPGVVLRAPSQPPEVLPSSQRMAKRARALVTWEEGDALSEVAAMTPTDETDWRA